VGGHPTFAVLWRGIEGFSDVFMAAEVVLEPGRSQPRHFLQGSRLLKQMGRSFNDRQMFFAREFFISLPIEFDHDIIPAADDEESGRFDAVER
jgi:hypothetical protein